jgi:RNA polymerase sigma-70 factor (ECF subfamily)
MYERNSSALAPNATFRRESGFSSAKDESDTNGMVRQAFNREYLQRLTDGDPETERHFTDYFGALVRIKLRTRFRSEEMIEDIRQETFLRVLTALRLKHGLESPENLGAFVNSVCSNLLLERYRVQSRNQSAELNPEDGPPNADSALVTGARKQQLRQVLEDLSEKDRELLRMVFCCDVDRAEICQRFHVDAQYLRVLIHRATARFKEVC